MTFPRLEGPTEVTTGVLVLNAYRGAKLTIIAPAGTTADYSFVDSGEATAHDTDSTVTTTAVVTTIDVEWPFILIDRTTCAGTIRVALT